MAVILPPERKTIKLNVFEEDARTANESCITNFTYVEVLLL